MNDQLDALQPWAANAANDTGAPDLIESQRPLPYGAPPRLQDVDWENDDTTHFRRDPTWSGDASWSGDLASLLEPGAFPSEPPSSLDLPPFPQIARDAGLVDPSSARTSLPAVEGGLARSLPPRGAQWQRSLWFVAPMLVVLGAGALWDMRRSDVFAFATRLPEPIVHYFSLRAPAPAAKLTAAQQPESIVPEPRIEPIPVPAPTPVPVPARVPVPDLVPSPPPGAIIESKPPEVRVPPAKERRLTRAEIRRKNREARRAKPASIAKPITPLRDDIAEDQDQSPANAQLGTLQVNSRPWARVFVDGRFVGHTPQRALKLKPGRHRIELINGPLDMSKTLDLVILPGQTLTRVEMLDDDQATAN